MNGLDLCYHAFLFLSLKSFSLVEISILKRFSDELLLLFRMMRTLKDLNHASILDKKFESIPSK